MYKYKGKIIRSIKGGFFFFLRNDDVCYVVVIIIIIIHARCICCLNFVGNGND